MTEMSVEHNKVTTAKLENYAMESMDKEVSKLQLDRNVPRLRGWKRLPSLPPVTHWLESQRKLEGVAWAA